MQCAAKAGRGRAHASSPTKGASGRAGFAPHGLGRCFRSENRRSVSKGSLSEGATAEALDQPPCIRGCFWGEIPARAQRKGRSLEWDVNTLNTQYRDLRGE
eukprot:bmy_20952T0